MSYAKRLADEIRDSILDAFAMGRVDSVAVRQFTVEVSRDRQSLKLWASEHWDASCGHDYGVPLNEVGNLEWLATVDALTPYCTRDVAKTSIEASQSEFASFLHKTMARLEAQLHADISAALRIVGSAMELGVLGEAVGFIAVMESPDRCPRVVAFYHPQGGGDVFPVREQRAPGNDINSYCTLTDGGVQVFYPEGDADRLAVQRRPATTRFYCFDDMAMYRVDRDQIVFRMRGDLHDVRLSGGYESPGEPGHRETQEMLLAHFKLRPELEGDPNRMPDPRDASAMERWSQWHFCHGPSLAALVDAVARYGRAGGERYLEGAPQDFDQKSKAVVTIAETLFSRGDWTGTLEFLAKADPSERVQACYEEVRALVMLERFEDAVARAISVAAKDGCWARHVLPMGALALCALGREHEAKTLLETIAMGRRHARFRWAWARAVAREPCGMEALIEALRFSPDTSHFMQDFAGCAPQLEFLTNAETLRRGGELPSARLEDATTVVAPNCISLDPCAGVQQNLAGRSPYAWNLRAEWSRPDESSSVDRMGRFKHFLTVGDGHYIVPYQSGGIVGLYLGDDAPCETFRAVSDSSLEWAVILSDYIYAADNRLGLTVLDLVSRQRVGSAARPFSSRAVGVAVVGDHVALVSSSGVEFYDVAARPSAPRLVGFFGVELGRKARGYPGAIAGREAFLYMAHPDGGLLVVDGSDPTRPQLASGIVCDYNSFRTQKIVLAGDFALLFGGERLWIVDISQPEAPKSVALLIGDGVKLAAGVDLPAKAGTKLVFLDDSNPIVWTVHVDAEGVIRVEAAPQHNALGARQRLYAIEDVVRRDDGALVGLTEDGIGILERRALAPLASDSFSAILASAQCVRDWVERSLRGIRRDVPQFRAGWIELAMASDQSLQLSVWPPRSAYDATEAVFVFTLPGGPSSRLEVSGDDARDRLMRHSQDIAWGTVLQSALRELPLLESLAPIASGRVYLEGAYTDPDSGNSVRRVVNIVEDESRPWNPRRRELVKLGPLPLEERLKGYKVVNKFARACGENEVLRNDVAGLARSGNDVALRILWRLREQHADLVRDTVLAASYVVCDSRIVTALAHFKDCSVVRERLNSMFERAPGPNTTVAANRAFVELADVLGRASDGRVLRMVRMWLANPAGSWADIEIAVAAMVAMEDVSPLRGTLEAWIERARPTNNRVPLISKCLFRAGVREAPIKLIEQVGRSAERCSGAKLGIPIVDDTASQCDDNNAACVLRIYIGWNLAARVRDLAQENDIETPVYPSEWDPQRYNAGWACLLRRTILHLNGDVTFLCRALANHVDERPEYAADRKLCGQLLGHLQEARHGEPYDRLLGAILAGSGFSDDDKRRIKVSHYRFSLEVAWSLLRTGSLARARLSTNQILNLEECEGRALFLDARLYWLESRSALDAIEHTRAHLRTPGLDAVGRGRLLNLIGRCYDSTGRSAEALRYFEQATKAHATEPMYLANVAECHKKIGNIERARFLAREALSRGAVSAVCEELATSAEK